MNPCNSTHAICVIARLFVGLLAFAGAHSAAGAASAAAENFDIVVCGATPGGIAAALTAARYGRSVALVEYQAHIGGMTASGLSRADVIARDAIAGIWTEFTGRVRDHYVKTYGSDHENVKLCRDGYVCEPSVAERIFEEMVAGSPNVRVFRRHRLDRVERTGRQVVGIRMTDRASGEQRELRGGVFIDCTYEGDLAALSRVPYRVGREARSEFGELHAGVVYMDLTTKSFLPGTTGAGDRRVQAYTFRMCLSTDPANGVPLIAPPPGYDRATYLGYIDDWKSGRFAKAANIVRGAMTLGECPNRKIDVNIRAAALGYPFSGENEGYAEGNWDQREVIVARIRNLTLGLLYFLQNDPDVSAEHRQFAQGYHLAKDEFTDNGHFPWQLYVREARRIVGEYTLSENDVILGPELGRPPIHADSISAGEYPIDSMPVRKREPGHDKSLEGYVLMLRDFTHPYHLPYRIIVPKDVDGLLVPVAASATHIAYSSIRLEPTWMALGQAAGTAAHLALRDHVSPRRVNVTALQRELLKKRQVLTYFKDIDLADPAYAALQFFGTRGFFPDYFARAKATLTREVARQWLQLALGDEGGRIAGTLSTAGDLTRQDLVSLAARAGWTAPKSDATSPTVSRGEFCRLLYEMSPPPAN